MKIQIFLVGTLTVFISRIKSLLLAVGMSDLMLVSQSIARSSARPIEILTAIALIHFAIGFPLTRVASVVEGRLLTVIKT